MLFAGIDIGSVTTKAVVIDENNDVLASSFMRTSYDREKSGDEIFKQVLEMSKKGRDDIAAIVATGYGRRAVTFADKVLPEVICHARGTKALFPDVKTIIDIGGQDSKVMELDDQGNVIKFEMNDKCAAGTGRFLEVLTERILNLTLDQIGPLSLKSKNPLVLSSVCTVFAESEIISFLSEKRSVEDIAYGMHKAIARRVINMGRGCQISYKEPIVFSGGVARNIGVVRAIEEELGKKVIVPDVPQITGALGSAIFARESVSVNQTEN